jgi:hypothetical protein
VLPPLVVIGFAVELAAALLEEAALDEEAALEEEALDEEAADEPEVVVVLILETVAMAAVVEALEEEPPTEAVLKTVEVVAALMLVY